ncbi:MAG: polysaccharide biosynthesis C-terminal domain-containing protein [Candidatus Aenigmarchaeota archaeon]|nr:polysaccharide biosynthesis C-terminal domain-containing protein [Candidatus Aenigmarchaeota archaeon]
MMKNPSDAKHPIRTKLISNAFFIFIDWFALSFFSFLYWFIIGKTLLPEEYGIVYVFHNITVIVSSLLPLGTSISLFKLIPEYIHNNQLGKITSSIRFTLKLLTFTTLITSLFIFIFSDTISTLLKIPKILVWLLPVSLFSYAVFSHQASIMQGFQHIRKLAITSAIGQILKVVIAGVLVYANMSFFGPIIGFIASSFILIVIRGGYLFYNKPPVKINIKEIVLKFGVAALLDRMSLLLLTSSASLILAFFYTPEVVGIFGVSMLIGGQLSLVPTIFSFALFPITSLLSSSKRMEKRQSYLINSVFRYTLLITLPIIIFVTLFSGKLITLLSQESYLSGKPLIPILAIGSLLLGISIIFTRSLYAIGKTNVQRKLFILTSVIYVVLSFTLTYMFSALGASIAYAISSFVLFVTSFIYLRKILKFDIPLRSIRKIIVANIVSLGILYVLSNFAPNILIGTLYTILVGMFYLVLLLFLRFYTIDDINLINAVSNHIPIGKNLVNNLIKIISKYAEKS